MVANRTNSDRLRSLARSRWEDGERPPIGRWICVLLLATGVIGAVIVSQPREALVLTREVDGATQRWLADAGLPQDFDPNWWLLPGGALLKGSPDTVVAATLGTDTQRSVAELQPVGN